MIAKIIESNRLIMKPLGLGHLSQKYVDWLNDSDINRYLETEGNYTLEILEEYIRAVVKKDIYFWGIHLKDNRKHIGNIKIDPINYKHRLAEYGILMGEKSEWAKGFATEATQAVLDYCFNTLNLRKVTLGVVSENTSAVNLYIKLGFEIEGVYKEHGIYENKYCDIIRMAMFNPHPV